MHSDHWEWGFGFGHGLVGMVFWLIIFAVIAALFFGLLGSGTRRGRQSPREILKERYARGEIDQEEYERRLKDIDR